jgi:hypothetical protein
MLKIFHQGKNITLLKNYQMKTREFVPKNTKSPIPKDYYEFFLQAIFA